MIVCFCVYYFITKTYSQGCIKRSKWVLLGSETGRKEDLARREAVGTGKYYSFIALVFYWGCGKVKKKWHAEGQRMQGKFCFKTPASFAPLRGKPISYTPAHPAIFFIF
jgi:hypothetical protein